MLRHDTPKESNVEDTDLLVPASVNDVSNEQRLASAMALLQEKQLPRKRKNSSWIATILGLGSLGIEGWAYFNFPNGASENTILLYDEVFVPALNGTCGFLFPIINVCKDVLNTTFPSVCIDHASHLCTQSTEMRDSLDGIALLAVIVSLTVTLRGLYQLCSNNKQLTLEDLSSTERDRLNHVLAAAGMTLRQDMSVGDAISEINSRILRDSLYQGNAATLSRDGLLPAPQRQHGQQSYGAADTSDVERGPAVSNV